MKASSLSPALSKRFSELCLSIPRLLMPATTVDPSTWAVVACDQYTSDQAYWNEVARLCLGKPSTLHITLPEIYLKATDLDSRIDAIVTTMQKYENSGVLQEIGESAVYIERRTVSGLRQGLLLAVDLEAYDYAPDSKTPVRATEGTITDRIPPRLKVRSRARLELPHIMILLDDPEHSIIEPLASQVQTHKPSYQTELMQHGGSLTGWTINDEVILSDVAKSLEALWDKSCKEQQTKTPLIYAMGDGNHSLATAKASWEAIKLTLRSQGLSDVGIMEHPARYALAEFVNIHSSGLRFEPIHRAIFTSQVDRAVEILRGFSDIELVEACTEDHAKKLIDDPGIGQRSLCLYDGATWFKASIRASASILPPAMADRLHTALLDLDPKAEIDFIHGWSDTTRLTSESAIAVMVPVIARTSLFSWVQQNGPLPRKSFSMGEAEEKRYYYEARKIVL